MSGGHYDYIYHKINDITLENVATNPKRKAFQDLLRLVAIAMHDIEWVDSGDYGEGDDSEAIDNVFNYIKGEKNERICICGS